MKPTTAMGITIVILGIALTFFMYKYFAKLPEYNVTEIKKNVSPDVTDLSDFTRPEGDDKYLVWTGYYRHDHPGTKNGVWYDSATIRHYLDSIYPKLVDRMGRVNTSGYKWGVGFYFMKHRPGGIFNFCVVPTLIKMDSTEVLDFFDPKNCASYNTCTVTKGSNDSTGYNAGHLWP